MSKGYRLIFWGLLFILIDIRIEVFDLLPDFIGYIFIVSGVSELSRSEDFFEKARPFAVLLIFLALPSFIGSWEMNFAENSVTIFPMVYHLITGIVHLLMMYFIFKATHRLATKNNDEVWAVLSQTRWNYYAAIHLLYLSLNSFVFNVDFHTLQAALFIIVIAILIVEIVIIVFIKRSEKRSDAWGNNIVEE